MSTPQTGQLGLLGPSIDHNGQNTPRVNRETHTLEEAAAMLGIGRKPMTVAIRTGQIPSIRLGKRYFIPKAALDRLMRQGAKPASDTAR